MTFRAVSTATVVLNGGNSSRLCLETAAGVGLRAAAAPPLALDRDGEFGRGRRRTRRLGGRRDRRVLEGMRGCSTHGLNIASRKNKSRTKDPDPKAARWLADRSHLPQKAAPERLI